MDSTAIEEIELSIQEAKEIAELGDALTRLEKNPDFLKVIKKDFLEGEAVRLVSLKAHPAMQKEDSQRLIDGGITAIGVFTQYLNKIHQQAEMARSAIEDGQNEISEMLKDESVQ